MRGAETLAAGKVIKESDLGDKCKECKEQEANSPLFGACVLRLPLLVALKAYVPLPRSGWAWVVGVHASRRARRWRVLHLVAVSDRLRPHDSCEGIGLSPRSSLHRKQKNKHPPGPDIYI